MKYDVTNTNTKNTPHITSMRGRDGAVRYGTVRGVSDQKLVALGYNFDISQSQLATRRERETATVAIVFA